MAFLQVKPETLSYNPFDRIGNGWFLLTAGTPDSGFNPMTCSWGAMGVLWSMPSVTCYVRRSRYTKQFLDSGETFTVSFFPEGYRKALAFCGAHSGRDCDKPAEAGLTPKALGGGVTFEEAELVFVCRKRWSGEMPLSSLPADTARQLYADGDLHTMYIGEIIGCYVKQETD